LVPISVGTGLSLFGDSALYTVLPLSQGNAGVTLAQVGLLLSVNRSVRLLINTPVGAVYDRVPRRGLFVGSLFLGSVSTLAFGLTTGFWPLLVARVLWGISWTGIWVGGNTILLDFAGPDDRGKWVGRYQAAFFLGAAAGALFGGALTDRVGFNLTFLVGGLLSLAGAILAFFVLPETRRAGPDQAPIPPHADPIPALRRGTKGEIATANALLGLNRLANAGVLPATAGLFLAQQFGATSEIAGRELGVATLTGAALGLNTLFSMAAVPAIGRLSDIVPTRWIVAAGGLLLGSLGFGLFSLGTPAFIAAALFLIAISGSSNTSQATALVGDLSPPQTLSTRLGVLFTVGDLGSMLGPILGFALLPLVGLGRVYLLVALLFVLLWLPAMWQARAALVRKIPV
jgi:MFS family permease